MTKQTKGKERTGQIDAVVVGGGGTGMAAAVALAEGGAKVVVFEKRSGAGGTTNYVEGTMGVESIMQRQRNIKVTREEVINQIMEYSHWRANPKVVRALVLKSGDTIEWLQKHGVEFEGPHAVLLGGPRMWHLFRYSSGRIMIQKLVEAAESMGVEIRYGTRGKRLLREMPDGRITGVVVEGSDGAEVQVNADAVVIGTGGYADNKEMLKKYTGLELGKDLFTTVPLDKMGEGIRMAWEVGAAEEGTDVIMFPPPELTDQVPRDSNMPDGYGIPALQLSNALIQPSLYINSEGVRFCNEAISQDFIHESNALAKQPGRYKFIVFDEEMKRDLVAHGGINYFSYIPNSTPLTNLDEEIAGMIKKQSPNVFIADTLNELAAKMGVDAGVFCRTVETYNGFCANARDDEFGKDRAYLRPVKSPKFYAFKCHLQVLITIGGIRINEKAEVIDRQGKVILGLYAGGTDAGGLYGDSYCLATPGVSSGFALNFGRIAGESIISYLKSRR